MKRHLYAIHRPYGLDVINNNGNKPNEVHRFDSRAAQIAWVAEEPEKREPIAATSYAARRALRYAAEGWHWPQKVMD